MRTPEQMASHIFEIIGYPLPEVRDETVVLLKALVVNDLRKWMGAILSEADFSATGGNQLKHF